MAYNTINYNGYDFDFENIAKELFRVTKKGGVVVWVVGDAERLIEAVAFWEWPELVVVAVDGGDDAETHGHPWNKPMWGKQGWMSQ